MKKYQKTLTSLGICSTLLLSILSGCGAQSRGENMAEDFSESNNSDIPSSSVHLSPSNEAPSSSAADELPDDTVLSSADAAAYTDFAIHLFQKSLEPEENTLISPLSVINALAMTANGAEGETLAQMENVFGTDISSLGEYLHNYNSSLPSGEGYKLHVANSIWLEESFPVYESFLQNNNSLFGADIYKAPFDNSTLDDINSWVAQNTDDMIPEILNEISDDAVMYLINALAFDADWQSPYNSYQVRDDIFTTEDGTEKNVQLMHSEEHTLIQDISAQNEVTALGFLKYYADRKYAFVTLLPAEGISIEDYVNSLSGEKLCQMLAESCEADIQAALPKFEAEYSIELKNVLNSLGMTDAFDSETADFSGISSGIDRNLCIDGVIHKTYIAVDEQGTKAGAATAVEMDTTSVMVQNPIYITLNRPFVYMIVDCEENLPVFIGTVMEP